MIKHLDSFVYFLHYTNTICEQYKNDQKQVLLVSKDIIF